MTHRHVMCTGRLRLDIQVSPVGPYLGGYRYHRQEQDVGCKIDHGGIGNVLYVYNAFQTLEIDYFLNSNKTSRFNRQYVYL
jgi:hypothetical protein